MKRIFILLISLCFVPYAWAQISISATTDKTDITLDDEITLTVQVTGVSGNMIMPKLPSLPAFNVYSRSTSQSTINGRSSFSFRYTMMPRFAGKATIGAVTFNHNGKTYKTAPITVRVYRGDVPAGTQAASQTTISNQDENALEQLPPLERELATRAYAHMSEPYFMVAAVSNKNPYINEPFTLAVRFYYSNAFYDAPYQGPQVSNLFLEEGASTQGQQRIRNTFYRYEEKRYTLSGVAAGPATVTGASVTFRPGSSPLSVLDRFFGGSAVSPEQTVTMAPVKLSIKPLPQQGKPTSFYGAVGNGYSLTAKLDRAQTEANEAVTWSATVQGPGNLKTTTDFQFPTVTGITAYPATPTAGYLPNNKNYSYKMFKTELVPVSSGIYTLPALQWSYFDPKTGTYKTLITNTLTLTVTPSTHREKQVDFGNPAALTNTGVQTLGKDIHYVTDKYAQEHSLLARLPQWKWMHALVFIWLAVCLFIASIGKKTAAKKQAYLHARSQLKKATTYEDVSDVLANYLLAKFSISTASLPLKSIVAELEKHHVATETCAQFAALWKELESARFAPHLDQAATLAQFVERTTQLLKNLEEHA